MSTKFECARNGKGKAWLYKKTTLRVGSFGEAILFFCGLRRKKKRPVRSGRFAFAIFYLIHKQEFGIFWQRPENVVDFNFQNVH